MAQTGANAPRKRFADADDSLIDEQFDLEPPEDEFEETPATLEEVEDTLGEAGKNWERPPPPPLNSAADRLVFQQLEVDFTSGPPNTTYYPTDLAEVPVLRMFGVNELGNSVCVFVHGFEPYFYAEAPTPTFSPDDCAALAEVLNVSAEKIGLIRSFSCV